MKIPEWIFLNRDASKILFIQDKNVLFWFELSKSSLDLVIFKKYEIMWKKSPYLIKIIQQMPMHRNLKKLRENLHIPKRKIKILSRPNK